ncbi:hypothetical protein [Leptolyngbya ohadii]|uniref:hypothetical protein n=1 Tax=Leptolyngbya ohadii TaxID=1962290 RepID=UPI000B5A17D3|nr:hypothetical protein [Leptolyngbya ohadii]
MLPKLLPLLLSITAQPALAVPPPEDQPEEVLRTEVIIQARSPVDGKPLTAREYAELQAREEAVRESLGSVSPDVRRTINLLRLRQTIRTFFPFLLR